MRGARLISSRQLLLQRIIPAYAGSTATDQLADRIWEDHPRVCGEHQNNLHIG